MSDSSIILVDSCGGGLAQFPQGVPVGSLTAGSSPELAFLLGQGWVGAHLTVVTGSADDQLEASVRKWQE